MKWMRIGFALYTAVILTSCASTPTFSGGIYGGILNPSPRAVYTVIYPQPIGETFGTYTYSNLHDGDSGTLKKCIWVTSHKVQCSWQDPSGTGEIRLTFDSHFRRFDALWALEGNDMLSATWNGVRIGNRPTSLCDGLPADACYR